MGRFSAVVQGTRARKLVVLPLPGAHFDVETGQWVGPTDKLDVRALRDDEHAEVLSEARAFAKKRGVDEPEDGDALYERGKMIYTLAVSCIDTDSPKDAPQPYFDGGWQQIHASENLTPEIIGYLAEQQALWQDEVNPLRKDLDPNEFLAATIKTAGGDMTFFVSSRLGMRWTYVRTLASQLLSLLASKSDSSQFSAPLPKETST